MKDLVVIPAREGSVGVKGKNKRPLAGKPLILHTVDFARKNFPDSLICVSTDDKEIIDLVEAEGLDVPFVRPDSLATSDATSEDVLKHALRYYRENKDFDAERIIMLQPTSPFRRDEDLKNMFDLYHNDIDMVVSGSLSQANPYYTLFEFRQDGYLEKSKPGKFTRRQDCPKIFEFNGSVYIMNVERLESKGIGAFDKILPFVMDARYSVDIDEELDFLWCAFLSEKGLV
ncbi:acylneuraminate cytidylyltransferase family protein [Cryomorpha ignava]|uniref:Acylneuraminate cytidylyltransferase family protein n=1 Tax=Cryomorpha ignava TaxID=101383 RepID=A0A7K3WRV3_9FLAO|nr:acylneuraminate cytidylyltransferase family protein [Cryomorpha ignava]NEN23435.1 acylneuraminate cytidylyltransferase family protein [Cryomorpha ignava]